MKKGKRNYNNAVFISFVVVVFIVFITRMFQIGLGGKVAQHQLTPMNEIMLLSTENELTYQRGQILDVFGRPIATDETSYTIYANVNENAMHGNVKDIDRTAELLSQQLNFTRDEIIQILKTPGVDQVEFGPNGQGLTLEEKNTIQRLNIPGIYFRPETNRYYVNDIFSSHLIGIVQRIQEENEEEKAMGQMGVEYVMEDQLTDFQTEKISEGIVTGRDVTLTIDSTLQNYLEDLMIQIDSKYQPVNLSAHLVEVATGRMLASSQRPTFNLNTYEGIEEEWRLLLVENAYEPGSTIKILTTAFAYDKGIVQPLDTFLSGSLEVYDTKIHDYNLTGWGQITYDEGLIHSSNVGVAKLVQLMGPGNWQTILSEIGFGKAPRSGFPNEHPGTIDFDNPVSAIMSGFGQGLLTSPYQLLEAFSMIGNDGKMMRLQYIDHVEGRQPQQPEVIDQAIKPEVADHILSVMVDIVEHPEGTAKDFHNGTTQIAAKTGTAQIADPSGMGYLTGDNDYYFSVISFFPASDPEYMLYISMQQPQQPQGRTGSQIISELFHPFVDYIMLKN